MIEQSNQSTRASEQPGHDSLTPEIRALLGAAQAKAVARSVAERPQKIAESIPKTIAPYLSGGHKKALEGVSPFGGAETPGEARSSNSDAEKPRDGISARTPYRLYSMADVPKRHRRLVEPGGPKEWTAARDKVQAAIGSGCLLALIGPRGPGKTQIAQQAVLYASAAGRTSTYTRAMTLIMELQAACDPSTQQTRLAVIANYRVPQLLIIDEFQERGETDFEARMLNHLLDLRYGDMTDTLLIANLTPDTLTESMGSSISERLRETGGIIECNWPSFRGRCTMLGPQNR